MHQTQCRHAALIRQIQEVSAHLVCQQQAFVNHGAARHARHVILFAVRQIQTLDVRTGSFADDVQLALQGVLHNHVITATDENLLQNRLFFAHGRRHRHVAVHRHIAPTQQDLTFSFDSALHLLLTRQTRRMLFRQKDHTHAVFACLRQRHALGPIRGRSSPSHFFAVQRIWQLNQNTRAVTHQLVRTHRTPMVQVLQNLQRIFDDVVRFLTLNMRHKAHAASIVLLPTSVQTVFRQMINLLSMGQWDSWN